MLDSRIPRYYREFRVLGKKVKIGYMTEEPGLPEAILRHKGRVIAVANQKGGVGKTTTTINVATSIARATQRVLLVDMDPQGNLTSGVGLKGRRAPGGTIYEALTNDEVDPKSFVLSTAVDNLSLIPADRNLTGAEIEMVSVAEREHRLRR